MSDLIRDAQSGKSFVLLRETASSNTLKRSQTSSCPANMHTPTHFPLTFEQKCCRIRLQYVPALPRTFQPAISPAPAVSTRAHKRKRKATLYTPSVETILLTKWYGISLLALTVPMLLTIPDRLGAVESRQLAYMHCWRRWRPCGFRLPRGWHGATKGWTARK